MPTLQELLACRFKERQHLLFPWLREQENAMVYADTGVGKSMFALSTALTVAGGGEFLGWKPERREDGASWRVLYIDGEMHIGDIQERAGLLLDAVPGIDRAKVGENLRLLSRQHQEPGTAFPLITDVDGTKLVLDRVEKGKLDLVILDNFSTLGEVEDGRASTPFRSSCCSSRRRVLRPSWFTMRARAATLGEARSSPRRLRRSSSWSALGMRR